MTKEQVCNLIKEVGIIPAIRVLSSDDAHFAIEAVARGGIPIVEVTMTVPEAVEVISHIVRFHPTVLVGAGTVLRIGTAQQCVDAGAGFITAPSFNSEIVEFAAKQNIAVLPGALTPTEVIEAWEAGSDFVKVFPCSQVGGIHQSTECGAASNSVDCGWRCEPTDSPRIHLGRSKRHRNRQ